MLQSPLACVLRHTWLTDANDLMSLMYIESWKGIVQVEDCENLAAGAGGVDGN